MIPESFLIAGVCFIYIYINVIIKKKKNSANFDHLYGLLCLPQLLFTLNAVNLKGGKLI